MEVGESIQRLGPSSLQFYYGELQIPPRSKGHRRREQS